MVTTQKVPTYYTWIVPWAKLPCSLGCQIDATENSTSKKCPECRGATFTQPLLKVLSRPCRNKGVDRHQKECQMCREDRTPAEPSDFAWRLWQWLQENNYVVWMNTMGGRTVSLVQNLRVTPGGDKALPGDNPLLMFLMATYEALVEANFKMEEPI